MPNNDILAKLNRLLAVTPESQLAVPPISRRTLVATVTEIHTLRQRVAELEAQLNTPGPNGQA
jgi:BMFP domain-containing protein YqiC